MPSIFLQEPLLEEELNAIKEEFPIYDYTTQCKSENEWNQVEIIYGNSLSVEQLQRAARLRWIHCFNADIDGLCLEEIKRKKSILVTISKGQNVSRIAEFVIGGILTFAKQFFHWRQVPHEPQEFWDWPLKETMWTLNKRVLLQVGLGEVGTSIVKLANDLGMKTWGMKRQRSFHPYCHKTFPLDNLHSLLPESDVVVLALPKGVRENILFGIEEFHLMKPDSIFIVVGSANTVDEHALSEVGKTKKFRGVLLDAFYSPPPATHSPLWDIPNCIMTPSIATYPESEEHLAFHIFRKNLRVFTVGKVNEMKNPITL